MERKCEAVTVKGRQCRKKAELYLQYEGCEYLTCKQHHTYLFRPYPVIKAQKEATAHGLK